MFFFLQKYKKMYSAINHTAYTLGESKPPDGHIKISHGYRDQIEDNPAEVTGFPCLDTSREAAVSQGDSGQRTADIAQISLPAYAVHR